MVNKNLTPLQIQRNKEALALLKRRSAEEQRKKVMAAIDLGASRSKVA